MNSASNAIMKSFLSLCVSLSLHHQPTCCSMRLTCKHLALLQLISPVALNYERMCHFVDSKHVKYYNSIANGNIPKIETLQTLYSLKHYGQILKREQALCEWNMNQLKLGDVEIFLHSNRKTGNTVRDVTHCEMFTG